jgi:hypothetical protein
MHLLSSEEEEPQYLSDNAKWFLPLVKLPSSFDNTGTHKIPQLHKENL